MRSGGRMFQVNLGVIYSAIHTIHSSLHPSTFCVSFLSIHPFICPSCQEAFTYFLPALGGREKNKIWALLSSRAAQQGKVSNTGEVTGVCAELHRAEDVQG